MAHKEQPWHSLAAGATAGAVEGFVTYPTEFVKTSSQFGGQKQKPFDIVKTTIQTKGITGLYSGAGALIIGNAAKVMEYLSSLTKCLIYISIEQAGVRFLTYDTLKHLFADKEGKVTAPRSLAAGLGAGVMESIFAVTPSETIKTKLIHDSKSPNPRYRGLVHGTRMIIAEEGIRGIYRGLFPVVGALEYLRKWDRGTKWTSDDETRSKFCREVHDIYYLETVCPREYSTGPTTTV
ncbi:hypothetical protein FRC17_000211 [Serendipita sp. 399]|nr:hypothetical protein FRC17_000211 [Serendipita sp. 399]